MLRIRRIYDDVLPVNRDRLSQVKEILKKSFNQVSEDEIALIGEKLRNPFKHRFRSILLVAESLKGKVLGFALMLHEPEIGFVYLDWIATTSSRTGGGVGGALYDRVRQETASLNVGGLFYECLPDDPAACPDPNIIKDNIARLRFYERYGARPIVHTAYETPVQAGDTCMPYLVYDGIESVKPLRKTYVRKVVRAILERKYASYCPPDYIEKVIASIKDDPVRLRDFKYLKAETAVNGLKLWPGDPIALIVNEHHALHHVHERGYVESPVRVRNILAELEKTKIFIQIKPRSFPDTHLRAVHDPAFIRYLQKACAELPEGKSIYPYIFPIRNKMRPPKEPSVLSGYYCIDTFTPINANVYPAARAAVNCALTAAREILDGRRVAYALIRPPGHHAERQVFGGFCYFNNNAVAAHYLSAYGKVAILDIDYHHGNGQQDIFYSRSDVLTVSIHGHPSFAYPYFCGFEDETGDGDGQGFNLNLPLPQKVNGEEYRKVLARAVRRIEAFDPQFLIVALGLDPAKGDPTGTWSLQAKDFEENGRTIGMLGLPTLVIQEGGYRTQSLGRNAASFFRGLIEGGRNWTGSRHDPGDRIQGVTLRYDTVAEDEARVRQLVNITGFFSDAEEEIAEELVRDRNTYGGDSGYQFIMADYCGRLVGYACYGPIPCTVASYDLYWIAVAPDFQALGLGRKLLKEAEQRISAGGGTRVYVDTSERPQYDPTRAFYEKSGYRLEAVLKDFYAPGDGKAIYCKSLGG